MLGSLIGSLVGGVLGARPKRHFGASRFLGGGGSGSFLNASNILTAAALGWAGYEIWRNRQARAGVSQNPTFSAASTPPADPLGGLFSSKPRSTVEVVPDPIDGTSRIAGLLVAAARADGELGEEEYGRMLREAKAAGADKLVLAEMQNPRPLERLVGGVRDPKLASDLYVLAFTIVRADESVHEKERKWLDELARLLGLDAGSVARLEAEAARRIDAAT